MEQFVNFMLVYIVYPWTYADNFYYEIFIPAGFGMMFIFLYYFIFTSSKKQNQIMIFLLAFFSTITVWSVFYGYIAVPLSICLIMVGRFEFREYTLTAYVRSLYGEKGPWYKSNGIDSKIDIEKQTQNIEYTEDNLGEFYISDLLFFLGYITALGVFCGIAFFQEGYQFFPNGYSEIALY